MTQLNALFFAFKISFLPNYPVKYYDYIVKLWHGVACNWCVSLDIDFTLALTNIRTDTFVGVAIITIVDTNTNNIIIMLILIMTIEIMFGNYNDERELGRSRNVRDRPRTVRGLLPGTLVPVSRNHLSTRNERALTVRDRLSRSTLSCGRSST